MNIPKISALFETSLASPITAAASSFTVASGTDRDGNALSGLYGFILNEGTADEEFVVGTISGTTVTITYRGCDADDPVTEVSANKKPHRRGASVKITDYPILAYLRNILNGESGYTIPNLIKYAAGVVPLAADDLADKGYVDSVVGGIATTVNVVVPGTAGETLAAGNLIYFDDTDNEWKKCDADTAASVENALLAIAQGAGVDGGAISGGVLLRGLDANQTGLTAGAIYYASNTAGGISSSAGTKEVTVGFSYSTTQLYFNPRFNQQLTEDEQDALAGTSGTPSSANKFVTNDDVASAATASKIARRNATGDITVPTTPAAATDAGSKAYIDASGKKVFISAEDGQLGSNVTRTQADSTTPVLRYADGATAFAYFACRVPAGATSISAIDAIYYNGVASALNLVLAFSISRHPINGDATVADSAGQTSASIATSGRVGTISAAAGAINGIGTITEGDIIGISLSRDSSGGGDTYNANWDVLGLLITFA